MATVPSGRLCCAGWVTGVGGQPVFSVLAVESRVPLFQNLQVLGSPNPDYKMLGSKGLAQLPNARKKLCNLGIPWDETKEFHELQPTKTLRVRHVHHFKSLISHVTRCQLFHP